MSNPHQGISLPQQFVRLHNAVHGLNKILREPFSSKNSFQRYSGTIRDDLAFIFAWQRQGVLFMKLPFRIFQRSAKQEAFFLIGKGKFMIMPPA